SRRGPNIRKKISGSNTFFASKLAPTRIASASRMLAADDGPVGASLLANRPGHPINLQRLNERLRPDAAQSKLTPTGVCGKG
ncbi:hypothetical protein, partial [Pseudomonas sp. PS02290]|uniref:hypothetical protein n=1 Tax=Pseudomonas sp. PS02290 TaxID=2991430 RepID=UPI00249AB79A